LRYFFLFIGLFILTGCTQVGPNFRGVDDINYSKEFTKDKNISSKELSKWWQKFNDKTLDTLVRKGYENNLDIKQAGLRILQARTLFGLSQALRYPQVQKISAYGVNGYQNSTYLNGVGVNFDLLWEIDFWGKYARNIQSAEANLYLSVASYRDIMTSVVSEIVRNYINYRVAQERIIYAKRNIAIQQRVTKMTEVQFNSGNVSELDMQQARTQLYTTKAKLPALELSKINSLNALAVLLGTNKDEVKKLINDKENISLNNYIIKDKNFVVLSDKKDDYIDIDMVPKLTIDTSKKIDISLIKRRPDVKVAQYKAVSANAKIGATKALLYPSFALFGSAGINSNDASGSWVSLGDAIGVKAGPALEWNIFQYGRIKNQIRYQDAVFEEAMLAYNKTLLKAVSEVSNALNGYMYAKKQLEENQKALQATIRAFNLSARQYNDGLVSYQRLLSTVEKLTLTQDLYAQIKGLVAINAVLLYKSLGGGWQYMQDKPYISKKMIKKLKDSGVDWGEYLDNVKVKDE
jgi:outer membrane protein TolC